MKKTNSFLVVLTSVMLVAGVLSTTDADLLLLNALLK